MGMYSHTDYCDLTIKEGKKKDFLKWLDEHKDWKDITDIDDDSVNIHLDGWKILSYWYESTLKEFQELNEFLEGELNIGFETFELYGIITFGEELKYSEGQMKFTDFKLDKEQMVWK